MLPLHSFTPVDAVQMQTPIAGTLVGGSPQPTLTLLF